MKSQKGNIVLILLVVFLIVAAINAGVWYFVFRDKAGKIPLINLPGISQVSTAPTQIPTIKPTLIPTPIVSDEEEIKAAFAKKYNKTINEIELSVSKKDATHASGSVRFAGEMGGGWFLAFKETTGWIVVADGNGIALCKDIEPYNFPVSMVEGCVDQNGKVVTRK